MTDYEKKGHPVLGIILGVIGIVAAICALFSGWIGGGIGLLFGLIALLIGISAVKGGKKGGGITSIVFAGIAITLAVSLAFAGVAFWNVIKQEINSDETPLMAKYFDNPNFGIVGALLKMNSDISNKNEEDQKKLQAQWNEELKILNAKAEEQKKLQEQNK